MKEKIEDIAKSIKRHRELEISVEATNNAVGRSYVIYNNEEQQLWLLNYENVGDRITYTGDGFPIYKNLKLGEVLILYHEGKHNVETPGGIREIEIFNRAIYNPSNTDGTFATDISIRLAGDGKTYSFRDIAEILAIQKEIDEDKERLKHATDEEARLLHERIEKKEQEKKSYQEKAQSFIRKHAELRYQPILDPIQETIKRSKIFDGSLIINGGPGTGKQSRSYNGLNF